MSKKEKLKRCPSCGVHVPELLKFCFNCDHIFHKKKKVKKKSK